MGRACRASSAARCLLARCLLHVVCWRVVCCTPGVVYLCAVCCRLQCRARACTVSDHRPVARCDEPYPQKRGSGRGASVQAEQRQCLSKCASSARRGRETTLIPSWANNSSGLVHAHENDDGGVSGSGRHRLKKRVVGCNELNCTQDGACESDRPLRRFVRASIHSIGVATWIAGA